jgi:RNA polymerase sigma-70 factor (ECF subfamily)
MNQPGGGGVLLVTVVDGFAGNWAARELTVDQDLEREFEARLLETSTLAFRVAYSVLRQREDAEDVAQDAFAQAYRHFARLRDRERFRAWLVRTTWRLALDRRRGDSRRVAREQHHAAPSFESLRELESQRVADIWRAIDALPDKLRIVIVLASVEGHDVSEVARLLDIPQGTVKSRLFNARKQLKDRLEWIPNDRTPK